MDNSTRYRQKLNNYLQRRYGDDPNNHLTYEKWLEGSDRQPTWHAIANLHEVEHGRGTGTSRALAMEAAAKQVLIALGVALEQKNPDEAEALTRVTA